MNNLWIKTLKFNEPSIPWFYISLFSKFIIANPCTLRKRRSIKGTIKNEGNYLS
ncbi:unknown protein [Microcystis aeruginosa NIES-843]|uniref:Uncharacterized protein n=1 Tax=Microcystis aeruginosa (strain NIES-843 / IAM M-2473) TaxID=449447 RepID=B0JLG0_MICAN|nr:unknown protein [Microcystis aeruginosa NIES-843]